jgi:hypothetical protein
MTIRFTSLKDACINLNATKLRSTKSICFLASFFFFFFFDMSTQGKGEERFELVTFALLGVVYNQLSYLLGTAFWLVNTILVYRKQNFILRHFVS